VKLGYLFDKNFYAALKIACDTPSDGAILSNTLEMILPESPYRSHIARWFRGYILSESEPDPSQKDALRRALLEMCTSVYYLDPPSSEVEVAIDSYLTQNLSELFKSHLEEARFIRSLRLSLMSYVVDLIKTIPTPEALQIAIEGVAFTADDILERMRVDTVMMENYSATSREAALFTAHYRWICEIIDEHRENPEWLALFVQFMTGQNNVPRDTLFKFSITRLYEDSRTRTSHRGDQFHIHTCSSRLDIPPLATMTKEDLLMSIESLMTARGYNID
jgi:hypothetical protein